MHRGKVLPHYFLINFRVTTKKRWVKTHSDNLFLTGIDDTHGLVLAGSADEAAITVPAHTVNDIRMHVLQGDHGLTCAHVPNDDLVVTTWQKCNVKLSMNASKTFDPVCSLDKIYT